MINDPGDDRTRNLPLLEGDYDSPGVVDPSAIVGPADMPAHVVLCLRACPSFMDAPEPLTRPTETQSRLQRRVAEGCLTVEMEASALIALAGDGWDDRGWTAAVRVRQQLFSLAADACIRMPERQTGVRDESMERP